MPERRKNSNYLAAIDCGTTEIKAAIFSTKGRQMGSAAAACPCLTLKDGRIEQPPELIIRQALSCLKRAVDNSRLNPKNIAAISVSSQRATVIPLDNIGKPSGNAISWQDMTGQLALDKFRRKISDQNYYKITGLPNNPIFSLAKILKAQRAAKYVLVHDYLMYHLGCSDYYTDWSNASLTGLFDVSNLAWNKQLLKLAGLNEANLPALVPSGKKIGVLSQRAASQGGLLPGTPLIAGGGDQQCGGLGAGCVKPGIAQISLGTAGVVLCYSARPIKDPKMRISTCAHAVPGAWESEGLQNSAGASLNWLKKLFGLSKRIPDSFVEQIKPGSNGALFFPFLAGASAPHWRPNLHAMFFGLTLAHGPAVILRAVMEGVSMETREILEVFGSLDIPVKEIRLTGGYSKDLTWNQLQADIYNMPVATLENEQASLLGAAMLAAYGVGIYKTLEQAAGRMVKIKRIFLPNRRRVADYERVYQKYGQVYQQMAASGEDV